MNSEIRYKIQTGTKDSNVALEQNTLKVCVSVVYWVCICAKCHFTVLCAEWGQVCAIGTEI